MWEPSVALFKPLLQGEIAHHARCYRKILVLAFLLASLGFAVLMSLKPDPHKEPAMTMPNLSFQSSQQSKPLRDGQQLLPSGSRWHLPHLPSRQQTFVGAPTIPEPGRSSIIARAERPAWLGEEELVARQFVIPTTFKSIEPTEDLVLVKVAETITKIGSIFLSSAEQRIPLGGVVIKVGPGKPGKNMTVKAGDTVIYSKEGMKTAMELQFEDDKHLLIREDSIMGKIPATVYDESVLSKVEPLGDRVLCRPVALGGMSYGGLVIMESAMSDAQLGAVLRTGPGVPDPKKPGELEPIDVKEGEKVVFLKSAAETLATEDGETLFLIRNPNIFMKLQEAA